MIVLESFLYAIFPFPNMNTYNLVCVAVICVNECHQAGQNDGKAANGIWRGSFLFKILLIDHKKERELRNIMMYL